MKNIFPFICLSLLLFSSALLAQVSPVALLKSKASTCKISPRKSSNNKATLVSANEYCAFLNTDAEKRSVVFYDELQLQDSRMPEGACPIDVSDQNGHSYYSVKEGCGESLINVAHLKMSVMVFFSWEENPTAQEIHDYINTKIEALYESDLPDDTSAAEVSSNTPLSVSKTMTLQESYPEAPQEIFDVADHIAEAIHLGVDNRQVELCDEEGRPLIDFANEGELSSFVNIPAHAVVVNGMECYRPSAIHCTSAL